MARANHVFNAAQVEGFALDAETLPDHPTFDPIERAERLHLFRQDFEAVSLG
ncbi:hypothetical protein [Mesorhizobium sp. M0220]|uniref:hypothetical protein n=1 Tax=Mesorhizobium sp. M0220 TaxID=2956920 RepID=UPI00333B649D